MFKRLLAATLLLLVSFSGLAATITPEVSTADTGNTPNDSGSFTPAGDGPLIAFVFATATTQATCTLTNSLGGANTFTQFQMVAQGGSAHSLYGFVSDVISTASAQTVQFSCASDEANGSIIFVFEANGVTKTGLNAIEQIATRANVGAGTDTTPDVTFAGSATTTNPTVVFFAQLANPAGITEPTNWTEASDTGYTTPDAGAEWAYRNSGFTGTNIVWGSTTALAWAGMGIEVDASADNPTFDSNTTVSAETTDTYTLSYNASANAVTFFAMAKVKDAAAPADCNAIEAGTGAVATASEATTGGADTTDLTIPGGDPFPLYDIYSCLENASGDSAVVTLADETLDVPSGSQYVIKSGDPGVGEEGMFDGASPAAVDGDYLHAVTFCDSFAEGADANALTLNADTTFIIDTAGDTSRQACGRRFYDVSTAAWSDASLITLYVNNNAPEYEEDPSELFQFSVDVAITEVPLEARWSDVEGDAITVTFQDALPTGLSNSSETLTGTPTVCSDQTAYTMRATDAVGDLEEIEFQIAVGATLPDVSGDEEAAAVAEIEALCSLTMTAGDPLFHASVPLGSVVFTSPAAGEVVEFDQAITYHLSLGSGASAGGGEAKIIYVLPSIEGLTRWVDYIPVSVVLGCEAGRYDNDGCWSVEVISSTAGLTAWSDYTPVFEVIQTDNVWRYENDGWIPVNTLTP